MIFFKFIHFLEAFSLKVHGQVEFLMVTQITPGSPSGAVCRTLLDFVPPPVDFSRNAPATSTASASTSPSSSVVAAAAAAAPRGWRRRGGAASSAAWTPLPGANPPTGSSRSCSSRCVLSRCSWAILSSGLSKVVGSWLCM